MQEAEGSPKSLRHNARPVGQHFLWQSRISPAPRLRMKRSIGPFDREPQSERPQPLTEPGVKLPQQFQEEDEADAFRRWLAHVEAGRIG